MSDDLQQGIAHVLQQHNEPLGAIFEKLALLQELNKILSGHLDSKLAQHCQVANYEARHLVVLTHHAVWATQVRFQIPQLMIKLQQNPLFRELKSITCKLVPNHYAPTTLPIQPMKPISIETAEVILESAKNIKYEKLRAVMQRIAMHTR